MATEKSYDNETKQFFLSFKQNANLHVKHSMMDRTSAFLGATIFSNKIVVMRLSVNVRRYF
jgi:hypothetical protein